MPKVRILPEEISNKIAAGEVVERPASVVKELVENALDAGSTRVLVDVEKGGRRLVRVSDDGCGMGRDDALLSLERYATSKIQTDKDLFSIRTLGFRGEALPSIAAVSRFNMVTNNDPGGAGTEIRIQGGKILQVTQTGAPLGTQVTVQDLFFNTPARRKFMKSVATETGHIAEVMDRIALGWPEVAFELSSEGRPLRRFSNAASEMARVREVLGGDIGGILHEIQHDAPELKIVGWLGSPEIARSTSRWVFIYINGRFVRDRTLQHALMEGFRGRLIKGTFPVVVIKLGIPEEHVDVNVHPTKNEVRFVKRQWVHDQVASVVTRALERVAASPWTSKKDGAFPHSTLREEATLFETGRGSWVPEKAAIPKDQALLWDAKKTDFLRVIGQFRQIYIVCETESGLMLIDQHAAHERIFFEQLQDADQNSAQRLLVPETLDLGFRESRTLKKLLPAFNALGVEIESFGGNAFVIKTVPEVLKGKALAPMIRNLVDKEAESGVPESLEEIMDDCLAAMACHAVVRAGHTLSREAMEQMVAQLLTCRNPAHCPHGRPTFIQWTDAFLEKAFFRKG